MARVMSGVRATARLHLGNYMGALKNFIQLQNEHQCFFGVMDWHAMTSAYKSATQIPEFARDIYAEFLAWGLDPHKSVIFIQSHVVEHLQIFFWLSNITPMGWLERVTTWKDAEEEAKANDSHNLGRFAYPVLQTADILAYRGEMVPIGQDQRAHLELSREILRRLNHLYGLKLPEPKPLFTETPLLPGLDGRKMSKSYGNVIELSEESASLQKKIRAMPTDPARVQRKDPGNPEICNVFSYHKVFSTEADVQWVRTECPRAGIGCGDCKGKLFENLEALISGPRERKKEILKSPDQLDSIIQEGDERARQEAQKTLQMIQQATHW